MSSAVCFNLDQSKILSPGNGLTLYQTIKKSQGHMGSTSCPWTTFEFFDRVEIIFGKGENAGFQHFFLSHNVFKRRLSQGC